MVWLRTLLRLGLLALLLCGSTASAIVVENLHRARVEVLDHSDGQLARATREALAQVLIKVSGDREVLRNDTVRQALDQAQRFMQRYRYLRPDGERLMLQVRFDPSLVNDLLRDARAPVWTANRPPVLVWLVAEDATGRHPVTSESNPELIDALSEQLERRGVPAVFPLYDLEDTLALSMHELWQLDEIAIGSASGRYGVANVLVGRVTRLPGNRWMGDWLYLYDRETLQDSFYGGATAAFGASAIDLIADNMAARYAVAVGKDSGASVLVRVDAVAGYGDYRRLLAYFDTIELIDDVWAAYVEGRSVVFRLSARADPEQLHRIIALNRRLARLESPPALARGPLNLALYYEWRP